MPTREIPPSEWSAFFDSFSRQHQGWLVTIEVLASDSGAQVATHELPLQGITAEMKDAGKGAISIMAGRGPEAHVTHTIAAPTQVRLKQSEEGADEALEIESASAIITLVRFRSAMPTEMVDGIL